LGLGVVFHDCTGPINFTASTHLAVNSTSTVFQESVRGYWRVVYPAIVTASPIFDDGYAAPPPGPGLGLELAESYLTLPDLSRLRSENRGGDIVTREISP
jgi:L-alanine-DL-glutamate epimerase-like enolase superfamily enzyme